jgi:hypothetical protein
VTRCRYLRRGTAGQCTAEAVDGQGEIVLCTHHLARAMELLNRAGAALAAALVGAGQ